jgi:hypothetical protein
MFFHGNNDSQMLFSVTLYVSGKSEEKFKKLGPIQISFNGAYSVFNVLLDLPYKITFKTHAKCLLHLQLHTAGSQCFSQFFYLTHPNILFLKNQYRNKKNLTL